MKLTLERKFKCNGYTIGHLFVDGKYFCDTLEDVDRGLSSQMTLAEINARKLKSITAIPTGTYTITLGVKSTKFGSKQFYFDTCGGRLPRLQYVPGFEGILIHCGNTAKDTDGCILVGENKEKGQVVNSQATFKKLYPLLQKAWYRAEPLTIEVK
jgi:hypothetical protein